MTTVLVGLLLGAVAVGLVEARVRRLARDLRARATPQPPQHTRVPVSREVRRRVARRRGRFLTVGLVLYAAVLTFVLFRAFQAPQVVSVASGLWALLVAAVVITGWVYVGLIRDHARDRP